MNIKKKTSYTLNKELKYKIKILKLIVNPIFSNTNYGINIFMINFTNLLLRGLEIYELHKFNNKLLKNIRYFYIDNSLSNFLICNLPLSSNKNLINYIPINKVHKIEVSKYNNRSIFIETSDLKLKSNKIHIEVDTEKSRKILIKLLKKYINLPNNENFIL